MTCLSLERRQILLVIILVMVMELPLRWIYHHHNQVGIEQAQDSASSSSLSSSSTYFQDQDDHPQPVRSALQNFVVSPSLRKHYRKPKKVPTVGIFSQPYYDNDNEYQIPPNHTMIAASYVKWLEAGGATAIAIPYDASPKTIMDIVNNNHVDGILFPGGASALPPTAKQVWDLLYQPAVAADKPASFAKPLWGTCLGFEWIVKLASGNSSILESDFVASNVSLPLEQVKQLEVYSTPMIYDIVTELPVTMNNHHQGISPQVFQATPSLAEHWEISSTNHDLSFTNDDSSSETPSTERRMKLGDSGNDRNNNDVAAGSNQGKQFVSTIEPKDPDNFPVYGVQWHPEKNAFEYATTTTKTSPDRFPYEDIDHSAEAIALTHHMSSFFCKGVAQAHGEAAKEE
mmetsp:Transcript_12170/g.29009  ORF Transcript_12170/g.29009 Transcript_12170/m.29009 type:complete len:401 (-) Transcript_12170:352-1554(-)